MLSSKMYLWPAGSSLYVNLQSSKWPNWYTTTISNFGVLNTFLTQHYVLDDIEVIWPIFLFVFPCNYSFLYYSNFHSTQDWRKETEPNIVALDTTMDTIGNVAEKWYLGHTICWLVAITYLPLHKDILFFINKHTVALVRSEGVGEWIPPPHTC